MAGPWDKYAAQQQVVPTQTGTQAQQPAGPWAGYAPASGPDQYTGSVLPFSIDSDGNKHFDSNAGLMGQVKRAFMAPGDAYTGKLQVMGPDGNVTPEAISRAGEFASVFSPMNPGVRAGDLAIPGAKTSLKAADIKAPAAPELKAAGSAGYDALRQADARYSSKSVSDMANALAQSLEADGFNATTAPNTFKNLDLLRNPPADSFATSNNIETARRTFGKVGPNNGDFTDPTAAGRVRRAIDSYVDAPPDGSVLPGSEEAAARAGELSREARGNYAAGKRSDQLTGEIDAAELGANAANSGLNVGNAIRSRAKSIVLDPDASAGFTGDELSAIRKVNEGTIGQNATRFLGNLLGGGGGLGMALTGYGGAAMTGQNAPAVIGTALPLAGISSKVISNALTKKALQAVDESTRLRSPLAQAMMDAAPKEAQLPTKQAALLKALLLSGQNNSGGGGW